MSAFGGFGQSSNQQSTGFGGFGSNNNGGSGFGSNTNTGFGGSSGSTLFGSNNNQQTTPAFGSGGFGSGNTGGAFGSSQPAFGATASSGGGLFGASTVTAGSGTGFGGFGSNTNNNASSTGSIFGGAGAPKPAFGASNNTSGGLFGSSNTSGNAFGANNQSNSAFGAPLSNALGTTTDTCPGTGQTPFQAHSEKEGQTSTNNVFNSISAMPAYLKYSPEELRLVDYNQGRRFGNTGGFGAGFGNSGFGGTTTNNAGGFGNSTGGAGGLFGSQTAGTSGFGSAQTNTGFGANNNAGGGLFGQNATKPATGALFGNTSSTTNPSGGGLFGSSNPQTQGAFGAQQPQSSQSSGFTFGSNANNNTPNTTNTGGGLFGSTANNNASGGGLFGQNSGGSILFGSNRQQQGQSNSTLPGFGQNQQNQQNLAQNQSNSSNTFGGFGDANQQKPGGLFSNTSTNNASNGGLFSNTGQNNQQPTTLGSLFNTNNNSNQSGGGLFGAKPAATGSSLFGNAPASNNTNSSGLFSGFNNNNNNTNQTQNAGSSLFGNNNQQQKPGGLFGTNPTNSGGGIFGNNNNNQQSANNSLFGAPNNANNAQQQNGGLFGQSNNGASNSLFGGSQSQQNILQPPQAMMASLTDQFPWGSSSIFAGLPPPPVHSPGPMATPISIPQKQRKSTIHPQYKLSPAAAARLVTPQRRGYGFTYSTYGTPSSVQSNASTPGGFSASRLGGSLTRSLGKSLSTSNLRRSFDPDGESILSPGAFSAGSSRYSGGGSLKRLTIDRSLRTDLFGSYASSLQPSPDKGDQSRQPGILKKKVSFDTSTMGGSGSEDSENTITNGDPSSATPSAQEQGLLRPRTNGRTPNGKTNGASGPPEMEQVRGNELAVVHEDGSPEPAPAATTRSSRQPQEDQKPGEYYMIPSRSEIAKMSKQQREQYMDFKVGREGCGFVVFNKPVDLNQIPLGDIFDKIVVITVRSLTCYPETISKPAQGFGLNVPSTIHLENSWPRQRNKVTPTFEKSGPRFDKHIERLKRVSGTQFVDYERDTGTWVFKVPHFTTYALEYDETESEGESLHQSRMSDGFTSPTPTRRAGSLRSGNPAGSSMQGSPFSVQSKSETASSPDDTFEFRRNRALPGAFEDEFIPDLEVQRAANDGHEKDGSFLGDSSASVPEDGTDEPGDMQDSNEETEDRSLVFQKTNVEMAGSYPDGGLTFDHGDSELTPKQATTNSSKPTGMPLISTPPHLSTDHAAWTEALQDTISPYKHDRQRIQKSLHPRIGVSSKSTGPHWPYNSRRLAEPDLTTSIDLMNSLFGKEEARRSRTNMDLRNGSSALENTTQNHSNVQNSNFNNSGMTASFPGSIRVQMNEEPYKTHHHASANESTLHTQDLIVPSLEVQRENSKFEIVKGVPIARTSKLHFRTFSETLREKDSFESSIWDLASILEDPLDPEILATIPHSEHSTFENRCRKENLAHFWEELCETSSSRAYRAASSPEERAIAFLAANNVKEACKVLLENKDFRLAVLVSQIGGEAEVRDDITEQIKAWRDLKALSEMPDAIRALYELVAGNVCICEGTGKAHIEDRANTFTISERFDMDWKSAFGLRLWYGIYPEEPWHVAVLDKYQKDLREGQEPRTPFADSDQEEIRDDSLVRPQDFLWSLLVFCAETRGQKPQTAGEFTKLLLPQNQTSPKLGSRLAFQMYHAYNVRLGPLLHDPESVTQITDDFAKGLSSSGHWLWAMFVTLHLPDADARHQDICDLLNANAAIIGDRDSETFKTLNDEFKIPSQWIFEAQALHAKTELQNPAKQVTFLLQAENWDEAHDVLCSIVGPNAVIEQDFTGLRCILDTFSEGKSKVAHWNQGGRIFDDYLSLQSPDLTLKDRNTTVKRILRALPSFRGEPHFDHLTFEEKVALKEMGSVVSQLALENGEGIDGSKVLRLPMSNDGYRKQTQEMSMRYYQALMSH